ncbi:MAG TPA: VCBS repeat-containing protein, partial [Gemmataceae bacterium]
MNQHPTETPPEQPPRPRRRHLTGWLLAAAVLLPALIAAGLAYLPPGGSPVPVHASPVSHFPPAGLAFERKTLGPEPGFRPQITNVKVVDLDADGLADVLVCDGMRNRVFWYRQLPGGGWDEVPLGDELNCPACATPVDLDG